MILSFGFPKLGTIFIVLKMRKSSNIFFVGKNKTEKIHAHKAQLI